VPFGKLSRAKIVDRVKFPLQDNPDLKPESEFLPQGGLGLSVRRGAASFQKVVIKPLE
jgi:hypothetical protein